MRRFSTVKAAVALGTALLLVVGSPTDPVSAQEHRRRDLAERTLAPSLATYLNAEPTDGGTVENVDIWGRRRLAYEINKKPERIYAVVSLQAEPAPVKAPDRQLSLNESVLRTKVIRPDAR